MTPGHEGADVSEDNDEDGRQNRGSLS